MCDQKTSICILLRFFWKKRLSAKAATEQIYEVEGENVVNRKTFQIGSNTSILEIQALRTNLAVDGHLS